MTAGQAAALIAAVAFAVLAGAGVVVLLRVGRLVSVTTRLVTDYAARADSLLESAQAAVDRTHEQLGRTESITASMDQVTANMAELSGHVSAMAGLARALSGAVSAPLTGAAALVYGIRRAVLVRRSVQAAVLATDPHGGAGARTALTSATGAARRDRTGIAGRQ